MTAELQNEAEATTATVKPEVAESTDSVREEECCCADETENEFKAILKVLAGC
jgi:hypothetical protein